MRPRTRCSTPASTIKRDHQRVPGLLPEHQDAPGDPAKRSRELEEENQAFNADESILGCIHGLQCACSCATVDKFVQETVDLTTTGWAADQKTAFLKTMTSRIPSFWPKALQR